MPSALRLLPLVVVIHLLPALACGDAHRDPGDVTLEPPAGGQGETALGAGDQVQVVEAVGTVTIQQQRLSQAEVERLLEWRHGRVVFNGQTLAAVVEELNRYNKGQLVIGDETIAGLRIVGPFQARDLEGFLAFLEARYGITATVMRPLDDAPQVFALVGPRAAKKRKKRSP